MVRLVARQHCQTDHSHQCHSHLHAHTLTLPVIVLDNYATCTKWFVSSSFFPSLFLSSALEFCCFCEFVSFFCRLLSIFLFIFFAFVVHFFHIFFRFILKNGFDLFSHVCFNQHFQLFMWPYDGTHFKHTLDSIDEKKKIDHNKHINNAHNFSYSSEIWHTICAFSSNSFFLNNKFKTIPRWQIGEWISMIIDFRRSRGKKPT